jgi:hypothetical protein
MIIYWEDIRWEVDDAGTSWATLADEDHNSLTLENRDGRITFHTDGSPSFEPSTVLEITALCMILSKESLGQAGQTRQDRVAARSSESDDASAFIPAPRHATDAEPNDIEAEATRLPRADRVDRSRRKQASRRVLPALTG